MSSSSGMGLLQFIAMSRAAGDDQAAQRSSAVAPTAHRLRQRHTSPLPRRDSPYDSDSGGSPCEPSQNSETEDSDWEPSRSSSNDERSNSQGESEALPRKSAVPPKSPRTAKSCSGGFQCNKIPKHDKMKAFCSHGDAQGQPTVLPNAQKPHQNPQLQQPAAVQQAAVHQAAPVPNTSAGGSDVIDQHVQNKLVEACKPVLIHASRPKKLKQCNILLGLCPSERGGRGESGGRWGISSATRNEEDHACRAKCLGFIKLLTDLMRKCNPKFKYTSISVNKRTLEDSRKPGSEYAHYDNNNAPAGAYVVAFGNFSGGEFWAEDEDEEPRDPTPRYPLKQGRSHPARTAWGSKHSIHGKFKFFNTEHRLHGPCVHNGGDRYIAVFFTPLYVDNGPPNTHRAKAMRSLTLLNDLGFNVSSHLDRAASPEASCGNRPCRESSSSGRDGERRKRRSLTMPTALSDRS